MKLRTSAALVAAIIAATTAGCSSATSGSAASDANAKHGPITVWFSTNQQEWQWGQQIAASWNAAHPGEKVNAQQIPAGKTSEEVISASIVAGNTACLVYNTAPAAVPQFQQEGGLVPLDSFPGARAYIQQRTGARASQYQSPDGHLYQMPWKTNPVMVIYNKALLAKAGIDPNNPPLATYAEFLATARKIVSSGAAQAAIWPSPTSDFYQPWFDFYPTFIAESGGKQLIENGKPQFDSAAGISAADFWRSLYAAKLAPTESYTGDAFGDGKSALAMVGPWAIAYYKGKVHDWGVAPVPTSTALPAGQVHTFSDEKSIGMYTACQNRGTAWDFLKYTTSQSADGSLLEATGQMPMRTDLTTTFPQYFAANPNYRIFADQASRTVEVPDVNGSVDIWQEFRNDYSSAVIFGKGSIPDALNQAAAKAQSLMNNS